MRRESKSPVLAQYPGLMLGAIAIVIVLVAFAASVPALAGALAAAIGTLLQRDGERRFADSELLALDD